MLYISVKRLETSDRERDAFWQLLYHLNITKKRYRKYKSFIRVRNHFKSERKRLVAQRINGTRFKILSTILLQN